MLVKQTLRDQEAETPHRKSLDMLTDPTMLTKEGVSKTANL
jgi:hypothetical protein